MREVMWWRATATVVVWAWCYAWSPDLAFGLAAIGSIVAAVRAAEAEEARRCE